MPEVMPPKMPPWWLVRGAHPCRRAAWEKGSLCWLPRRAAAANPAPNSTPRTAGMPNRAAASRFSTPSNMGSPRPAGTPSGGALHDAAHAVSVQAGLLRSAPRIRWPALSSTTGKGLRPAAPAAVPPSGPPGRRGRPPRRRWRRCGPRPECPGGPGSAAPRRRQSTRAPSAGRKSGRRPGCRGSLPYLT